MLNAAEAEHSAHADDRRSRLHRIIFDKSLLRDRSYKLASGRTTGVYFDMKKTTLDPEGANLVADEILDLLEGEDVDFIGGLAVGAVPLITAVCMKSVNRRRPLCGFFVRRDEKSHGTRRLIDGYLEDKARVVLFDDVTTTGGSVMLAVEAVRARGCQVSLVVTIVDRLEGATENLAEQGIRLVPIFTKDQLVP